MALLLDLADALAFLGLAGTVLAVGFAIVAAIALAILRNPAGGGIATGGWLVCVMLSLGAGFGGNWLLPTLALTALPLMLTLAGSVTVVRAGRANTAESAGVSA